MKIFIPYDFPNWNKYIDAERSQKFAASKIKKDDKRVVSLYAKEKYNGGYPVKITFTYHFANKRKDLDNARLKGLIDGLVASGVIKNDNLNCIQEITLKPKFTETEGVEIEIEEMEEEQ